MAWACATQGTLAMPHSLQALRKHQAGSCKMFLRVWRPLPFTDACATEIGAIGAMPTRELVEARHESDGMFSGSCVDKLIWARNLKKHEANSALGS